MARSHSASALLIAACLAIALAIGLVGPAQADEDSGGRYPGLPFIPCPDADHQLPVDGDPCPSPDFLDKNGWINSVSVGRAGSVKAKQWARVPLTVLGTNVATGSKAFPDGAGGSNGTENYYYVRAFFVSPEGSDDNYGTSPPVTVRTVAFGSIPTEVTMEIRQARDRKNLPEPLELSYYDEGNRPDPGGYRFTAFPASLNEMVEVRVTRILVDGVDVGLTGTCSTGPKARLDVKSEKYSVVQEPGYVGPSAFGEYFDKYDPMHGLSGFYGGTLEGTINIPSLHGCTSRVGDDIAPLLTSALSSDDNPVTVQIGSLNCVEFNPEDFSLLPPKPGTSTPAEAGCSQTYYEYPDETATNRKVRTVPFPLQFPGYAPGDTPD